MQILKMFLNEKHGCLYDAVVRAKIWKAAVVDGMKAEVLKSNSCINLLYNICNLCFLSGQVPPPPPPPPPPPTTTITAAATTTTTTTTITITTTTTNWLPRHDYSLEHFV